LPLFDILSQAAKSRPLEKTSPQNQYRELRPEHFGYRILDFGEKLAVKAQLDQGCAAGFSRKFCFNRLVPPPIKSAFTPDLKQNVRPSRP
jgi:hypothetical protein